MSSDLAKQILKRKYGKGITNITTETFSKDSISQEQSDLDAKQKFLEKNEKDLPESVRKKMWKSIIEKQKKLSKQKSQL